jgi:hypothetical protein
MSSQYEPTTQKALFNKDGVRVIKQWLDDLELIKDHKRILCLSGPVGCGKTSTLKVLLKTYNVFSLDATDIRLGDKILEVCFSICGFADKSLANIEKWNSANQKRKFNIVVLDNADLCEKNIIHLIDCIQNKKGIDVPIVVVCNSIRWIDSAYDINTVVFQRPSLGELSKLSLSILNDKNIPLTNEQAKRLITVCKFDVRQLLLALQQLNVFMSNDFNGFLDTILKDVDTDLQTKMDSLLLHKWSSVDDAYLIASAEPLVVGGAIFQNYTQYATQNAIDLQVVADAADEMSSSNQICGRLFDEQNWELYDAYTVASSVMPSYKLRSGNSGEVSPMQWSAFKDVSYNFLNSYNEVQRASVANNLQHRGLSQFDTDTKFFMAKLFVNELHVLIEYFEKTKKGKNTSIVEKLDMCDNIVGGSEVGNVLENIVNRIVTYGLYDVNHDEISPDCNYRKECGKVDLKALKRFINIFTFTANNKHMKSHVDVALRYKVLQKLCEKMQKPATQKVLEVSDLMDDLTNIWKLKVQV